MTLRLVASTTAATGVFLRFDILEFEDEKGRRVLRDVVRHPGGVGVLAIEEDKVFLVRQHRAPFRREIVEIPAGKLDPPDEDPFEAARRECREELGADPGRLTPLTQILTSPGYTDEVLHLYVAEDLSWGIRSPDGIEEENAVVVTLSTSEALRLIESGELTDAKTQVALLLWNQRRLSELAATTDTGEEEEEQP